MIDDTKATPAKKAPAKKAPAKKAPAKKAVPAKAIEAAPAKREPQYTEAETDLRLTGEGPFQVMPKPDESDLADLTASIEKHGIMQPITVDEDGVIIDGHQRAMVAMKLGKDIPTTTVTGLTETEKRSMAYTLNMARRHLTRQQKRDLVADSLKRDPTLSNQQHAERIGVSPTTVATIRTKLEEDGSLSKLEARTTKSGRTQTATPKVIAAARIEEAVTFVAIILEGDEESARLALWDFGYWFDSYGRNRNGTEKKGAREQAKKQLGISDFIIDDALKAFCDNPNRAKYAAGEPMEMIPGTNIPTHLRPQPMTPPTRSTNTGKAADEAGAFDRASGKTAVEEKKAQAEDDAKYQHGVLIDLDKRAAVVRGDLLSLRENWNGPVSKADAKLIKSVLNSLSAALDDVTKLAG